MKILGSIVWDRESVINLCDRSRAYSVIQVSCMLCPVMTMHVLSCRLSDCAANEKHAGWLVGWLGLMALTAQIGHIVPK